VVRNFFAYYKPNIEIEEDREGETRAIWKRIERATENSNDDKVNIIVQKQILLLRYTVQCKRYGTRRTVVLLQIKCLYKCPNVCRHSVVMHSSCTTCHILDIGIFLKKNVPRNYSYRVKDNATFTISLRNNRKSILFTTEFTYRENTVQPTSLRSRNQYFVNQVEIKEFKHSVIFLFIFKCVHFGD
jgi:hypothetical protein